jgi:hypothetical protein
MEKVRNILWPCLLLLACLIAQSFGQEISKEQINKYITGTNNRKWVVHAWKQKLSGDQCESGEVWSFQKSGQVVIKKCLNETPLETTKTWKLIQGDDNLFRLDIGGDLYLVTVKQEKTANPGDPPILHLLLRTERKSMADPITMIDLRFQDL